MLPFSGGTRKPVANLDVDKVGIMKTQLPSAPIHCSPAYTPHRVGARITPNPFLDGGRTLTETGGLQQ